MGSFVRGEKSEIGSSEKYRCPACRKRKEKHEIFWERLPFPGESGKVRCCVSCSGVVPLLMSWSAPQSASWAEAAG